MAYAYPKISSCLTYRKHDETFIEVKDCLNGEVYCAETERAKYMRKLDGKTHPFEIETSLTEEEIESFIEDLAENELLRTSRKWEIEEGSSAWTLLEPKWTKKMKMTAFLCNKLLMLLWFPILIMGIQMFCNNFSAINLGMEWLGCIIGVVAGTVLHELGHAFAGVSYGAKVFEMGVLTMYYIVPGAYVVMDTDSVKKRLKRVQINAAGVEMNLLLTGLFLILSSVFPDMGGVFFCAAIQNAFLAVVNLMLVEGLDGMAILSELLGAEDLVGDAKDVVFYRETRKELREFGMPGHITIATCYMICVFQIAMPLFLALSVLEGLVWLF